jgi:hypothetical protein
VLYTTWFVCVLRSYLLRVNVPLVCHSATWARTLTMVNEEDGIFPLKYLAFSLIRVPPLVW